jgi:hypothetical protein
MKITFGCIVFNILSTLPKDMFKYCIENVYDIAHEIIIVEGATLATSHYFDGDTLSFTKDGRSSDGTIEYLKELQKKYPKINLIIGDGFWNGKTEMCNEYAKISTGDYIWQLDSDEFYKKNDQIKIIHLLEYEKPDAVHFYANHFFGGFDYCMDERNSGWGNNIPWMRIFKNIPGKSKWLSHEPPQYFCDGLICNDGKVIDRDKTLKMGIKMYHYSYVCENQIKFKDIFFRQKSNYQNYWNDFIINKNTMIWGSKVYKFDGVHPDIIKNNYL